MNTITQNEVDIINYLSSKIDENTASVDEYEQYEVLLLKAGFSQEDVRTKMKSYGYITYNQYLDARNHPKNAEQRKIVRVIIAAGLVVLSAVVLYWIASGRIRVGKDK